MGEVKSLAACNMNENKANGTCTDLAVHLWQQLQQLLLGVCGESREGANIDEGSDVGVDQNGAWRLEVHIHPISTPFHRSCHDKTHRQGHRHGSGERLGLLF